MDINSTAAAVATALAPFAPYLVEGGKKFAGQAGDAAWKQAEQLWGKLSENFNSDNKIKGKILSVSADPNNLDEQAGLAKVLAERLEASHHLAQEFYQILGNSEESVQKILADRSSWVEDVTQQIHGKGQQIVEARNDSVIKKVKQIKK